MTILSSIDFRMSHYKYINVFFAIRLYHDQLWFQNVSPLKVKTPPPIAPVGRTSITVGFQSIVDFQELTKWKQHKKSTGHLNLIQFNACFLKNCSGEDVKSFKDNKCLKKMDKTMKAMKEFKLGKKVFVCSDLFIQFKGESNIESIFEWRWLSALTMI